jgi:hypothetical protein
MFESRKKYFWALCPTLVFLFGCTSKPLERIPSEKTLHFPFTMAMAGSYIIAGSSSADNKDSFGRMILLDSDAVKAQLAQSSQLDWNTVVKANALIKRDLSEIVVAGGDNIFFATREANDLHGLKINQSNGFGCASIDSQVSDCHNASHYSLDKQDPFSMLTFTKSGQTYLLISYLTSDDLDLLQFDTTQSPPVFKKLKSFYARDFVKEPLGQYLASDDHLITRKLFMDKANDGSIFMLLEHYENNKKASESSIGAYLVELSSGDLLAAKTKPASTFYDLKTQFALYAAHDFFVDTNKNAYVLGRVPEILFKIDLAKKSLIKRTAVCAEASMMAYSSTENLIVVPCFQDNRVTAYTASELKLLRNVGPFARGPVFALIDDVRKLIYVSLNLSDTIGIFDLKLNVKGFLPHEPSWTSEGTQK